MLSSLCSCQSLHYCLSRFPSHLCTRGSPLTRSSSPASKNGERIMCAFCTCVLSVHVICSIKGHSSRNQLRISSEPWSLPPSFLIHLRPCNGRLAQEQSKIRKYVPRQSIHRTHDRFKFGKPMHFDLPTSVANGLSAVQKAQAELSRKQEEVSTNMRVISLIPSLSLSLSLFS